MAISIDSTATSSASTSSPFTWNHTCSGDNRLLLVGIACNSYSGQPTVTGVTYGGVSMVKIRNDQYYYYFPQEVSIWILYAPSLGNNQISVTWNTGSGYYANAFGFSSSYTGAQQSNTADSSGTNKGAGNTSGGNVSAPITTITDSCWRYGVAVACSNSTIPSITAGLTSRGTITANPSIPKMRALAEDSNGPKTPAGSSTIPFTIENSLVGLQWIITGISFAPAEGSSSSIKTALGLAKASVKTVNGLAIASVKTINSLA